MQLQGRTYTDCIIVVIFIFHFASATATLVLFEQMNLLNGHKTTYTMSKTNTVKIILNKSEINTAEHCTSAL